MAVTKNVKNYPLFTPSHTMGASFQSSPIDLTQYDRASLEIKVVTGSAVGTVTIQASDIGTTDATWVDMQMDAMPIAGVDKTIVVDITNTGLKYIRVAYTFTSGAGTMTVQVNGKES